jgi:predicted MFS family arabinose efflux permease
VLGPPAILAAGAAFGTGPALAATGVLLAVATLVFAASRASRNWRPTRGEARQGALRSPGLRTLVAILLGVGTVFGATEVAVTATGGHAAGPLLGLWGLGSLIGGLVASKLGGGARSGGGLVLILAALGAGHAALALAASPLVLGGLILLAGSTIAPAFATIHAMVDAVAPRGAATEAFAWLATASAVGASIGAAVAGRVVDVAGGPAAFAVAGLAAAVAAVIAILRARTLPGAAVHTPQGAMT